MSLNYSQSEICNKVMFKYPHRTPNVLLHYLVKYLCSKIAMLKEWRGVRGGVLSHPTLFKGYHSSKHF